MAELIYENGRLLFTAEMRREYTILVPQMAPYHFDFVVDAFTSEGYRAELLKTTDYDLIHEGMKYAHNDICVPAMLVIGQFIDAIKKRALTAEKVALIITQTGGGCRASNYIALLRKALVKAGFPHVPVISLNAGGLEKNPGFRLTPRLLHKVHDAMMFGDLVMTLINQVRPYETSQGATNAVHEQVKVWLEQYFQHRRFLTWRRHHRMSKRIVKAFADMPVDRTIDKPKVGIVGEIYVKYSPLGNNHLEATLEAEGCEVVTPPLYDFFLYSFDSRAHDIRRYGGPRLEKIVLTWLVGYVEWRRGKVRSLLKRAGFAPGIAYKDLKHLVDGFIDVGTHSGEGWLLTAEMIDLIRHGAPNIVCTQPFGCLPNHIAGKGMIKKLKKYYPESNIVAIDFDTSASKINQLNRINLMVSNAFRNQEKK
ncbi:MAG: 2-hydroxyglutaryl-CoA dehydratase [Acholeplasmatales bacterium]|nr:MAG: 2-hydroxyglutaryl-CoA dehydratase [Acholeplasmatales bacterium]